MLVQGIEISLWIRAKNLKSFFLHNVGTWWIKEGGETMFTKTWQMFSKSPPFSPPLSQAVGERARRRGEPLKV